MAEAPKVIHFHSDAVPADTFLVTGFTGAESISSLYRFELDLVSKRADIDFKAMLEKPAYLGIKTPVKLRDAGHGSRLLKFGGMVCLIRQLEKKYEWTKYRAVLVPRLWRLGTDVMTRVFIEKSVPDMIEEILKEEGFASKDYEFRCAKGPTREFAVQYQESDWDFVQRWLEHEGIFYFFEQTDEGEKVVFADSTAGYLPILGGTKVPYRPIAEVGARVAEEGAADWFKEEVIQSFAADQQVIPKKVILKDYNWRTPSEDLKVDSDVVPEGMGTVYYYADHYKDKGEGKTLAKARAEEFKCRQKLFSGTSDHKSFRAGSTYQLDGHYRAEFNKEYVLVELRHRAEQALGLPWAAVSGTTYGNEFVSIPKTETFRPERRTPWPSVHGVMHGKVDAGGDGKYAEIDDMGRYKVILPFDLSGRSGGKASRHVRMMQPYAGGGMGMHFPLHKGTEVLLAFLDGDPDRPIIVGAIPNPETSSPVTGGNHTQCAIHTGGGNQIVIEDTDGSQRIKLSSPTESTYLSLGAPNQDGHAHLGTNGNSIFDIAGNWISNVTKNVGLFVTGDREEEVKGNKKETVVGTKKSFIGGWEEKMTVGATTDQVFGGKNTFITPLKMEYVLGAEMKVVHGLKTDIHRGWKYSLSPSGEKDLNKSVRKKHLDEKAKIQTMQLDIDLRELFAEHLNSVVKKQEEEIKELFTKVEKAERKFDKVKEEITEEYTQKLKKFEGTVESSWKLAKSALAVALETNLELKNSSSNITVYSTKVTVHSTVLVINT